jgi:hypothetical protein
MNGEAGVSSHTAASLRNDARLQARGSLLRAVNRREPA